MGNFIRDIRYSMGADLTISIVHAEACHKKAFVLFAFITILYTRTTCLSLNMIHKSR